LQLTDSPQSFWFPATDSRNLDVSGGVAMKIKVEFELTPQEFRESLGLPNISALQDEALAMLRDRITSNVENLDLAEIVESWFSQGIAASRKVQEILVSAASSIIDGESDDTAATTKKTKKKPKSGK